MLLQTLISPQTSSLCSLVSLTFLPSHRPNLLPLQPRLPRLPAFSPSHQRHRLSHHRHSAVAAPLLRRHISNLPSLPGPSSRDICECQVTDNSSPLSPRADHRPLPSNPTARQQVFSSAKLYSGRLLSEAIMFVVDLQVQLGCLWSSHNLTSENIVRMSSTVC
ncbi:uncharacterized protein LOC116249044 [Nymphaea colorata]|nr:uncharacterized protein LOC116249044 [Nymphaea colorata]